MTLCTSNELTPGLYSTSQEWLTSYNARRNTSCQLMSFQVSPKEGALPFNAATCCEDQKCDSTIAIHVCTGIEEHVVKYLWTGATGARLHEEIALLLMANSALRGLGIYRPNGESVEFVASQRGWKFDFRFKPGSNFMVRKLVEVDPTDSTGDCKHGQVVHTDCATSSVSCAGNLNGLKDAFAPSQDPKDPNSTEVFAGIVVDLGHGDEQSYNNGLYHGMGVMPSGCKPPKNCVEVWTGKGNDFVNLCLESPAYGECIKGDKLYYRYAPHGEFTQMGLISTVPGEGLTELPIKVQIFEVHGMHLLVKAVG